MRTTLDLDDELIASLLRRHPGRTKTAAIETAIRDHLARAAAEAIIAMAGTVEFDEEFLAQMERSEQERAARLEDLSQRDPG